MILVNNPGTSQAIYAPLRHAVWHGWTFTDLVFPFFLWITGVSMTFSFARRVEQGADRRSLLLHALRRSILIFAVGMFLNGFPYYPLAAIRIPGVLQRIAVCYFLAASIFLYTRLRGRLLWTAGLLTLYVLLMRGGYEQASNFARYVDGLFLTGHMYSATKTWDPEGIVSTIPAIATTLLGILAGQLLRSRHEAAWKTAWMLVAGNGLIAAGLLLDPFVPINKNLWTSSYAVFMAGMAQSAFAAFYWIIDVQRRAGWARPLAIYGMNALAVYVLSGLIARVLGLWKTGGVTMKAVLFERVFAPLASPINASMLYGLANVLLLYLVAYGMYRRRWFVKL
ncbi:MAG: DUF5009 domain-containing protein [Acidobacteria bacterium]|nr:DUF5009 domain-containing protein [Acidobacteriota bacterium]